MKTKKVLYIVSNIISHHIAHTFISQTFDFHHFTTHIYPSHYTPLSPLPYAALHCTSLHFENFQCIVVPIANKKPILHLMFEDLMWKLQ